MHVNVPLTPLTGANHALISLTADGPSRSWCMVPVNASVTWLATLGEDATAQELADQQDHPMLQPRTGDALDPLSSPLGLDGGLLLPGQRYTRRFVTPGDYVYSDGLAHTGTVRVVPGISVAQE